MKFREKKIKINGLLNNLQFRWKNSPTTRNIILVYSGDLISKIIALGTTLFLIRGLTTQDYAYYIAFTSFAILSASLVGGGINSALVRFSAEYFSLYKKRLFSINLFSVIIQLLFFSILFTIVMLFPSIVSKIVFGSTQYINILTISMILGAGMLLIEVGRSMMQAEELYKRYIVILWIRNICALLFIGILWFFGKLTFIHAALGLAILHLLIGIIVVIIGTIGFFKDSDWVSQLKREKYILSEFLFATGWLIAYYFLLAAMSRMDVLMLTRFSSQSDLAVYGVAFQYYSLAFLLLGSISAVLKTKFSKVEMQGKYEQQKFLSQWFKMTMWVCIPILLFIIFGKQAFIFLNGQVYEDSFKVVCILLIGVWLSLMLSPLANILIGRKDFKFLFSLGFASFLTSVITNYWGVRNFGAIGAAIALIVTHNLVLQLPILLRILKK